MTEQRVEELAQPEDGVSIEACWISEDVRADRRSQKWLNVIFGKGYSDDGNGKEADEG